MDLFRLSLAALLCTCFAISANAQRRPAAKPAATPETQQASPPAKPAAELKIAFVDTAAFAADDGIIRYRDVVRSIETELKPRYAELQTMQTRIDALRSEVATLSRASVVSQESITAKQQEAEKLFNEQKTKKEAIDSDFERRYNSEAVPISRLIGASLTLFADERGIALTIDLSKLMPAILTINPKLDLTKEFIADYNRKNPVMATPRGN